MEIIDLPRTRGLRAWARDQVTTTWGGPVARQGKLVDPRSFDGFAARRDGELVGLATYDVAQSRCEIVTLEAMVRRAGVGRALVEAGRTRPGGRCRRPLTRHHHQRQRRRDGLLSGRRVRARGAR